MSANNNKKKYNKCIYKVSEVVKHQLLFQDNGDIQHTWQGPWKFHLSHFHTVVWFSNGSVKKKKKKNHVNTKSTLELAWVSWQLSIKQLLTKES